MIEKGIEVADLLKSKVFCHEIDFQEWPTTHANNTTMIAPYNDTLFQLRKNYKNLFGHYDVSEDANAFLPSFDFMVGHNSEKVCKIKYTLNILPKINDSPKGNTLMRVCGATDELRIFECRSLLDLIEFKWKAYAGRIHNISLLFHCWYTAAFTFFVNVFYVYEAEEWYYPVLIMLSLCLIYPSFYDLT